MAVQNQVAEAAKEQKLSRTVDTPDFVVRLAEDMRVRSGSDLPLSCFIEQVRMQLAGKSPSDVARIVSDRPAKQAPVPKYQSSDCFKSWAMPD
ncbi:hypothetical protein ACXHXG_09490 [Rhizobium sp. LEGMi198b]|uniref:hypothetical protein n=1 Tax=unclassified Rhizobium TaxID=2613769 RepID=UPI000CDF537D|nr:MULTISPECIES: hypothetical protein [Rhizobium]AVA22322.1 hypothetical protein NXC24_CH02691 [Rhizobium sp. NXC24]MDK4738623.1 hypothetical protein [Rhizobium sp. CNPSo 3464]UWU19763.1 hypothetical protein N2601_10605 [Rhizobium tropici]WFU00551.1 hypothetical protein QA648_10210 [Rhizobium sp. CB3171]